MSKNNEINNDSPTCDIAKKGNIGLQCSSPASTSRVLWLEIAHNPLLAILPTLARIYETQKIYEQAYERIDDRIKWDGVKAWQPNRIW